MALFRVNSTKFLGPITPIDDPSPSAENLPASPPAQLALLCRNVLAGKHAEARSLAVRFTTSKPKGSDILHCWFDGAAWPNPGGHGAFGALVRRHGKIIFSASEYLGQGAHITNNVAEYAGAIAVLRFLIREGIQSATVYGDSRMVIQQLNGQIKAKHGVYIPQYREARELRAKLPDVRLVWISRGQNTEADALSKDPLKSFLPS
jgi:ribonuclease HI